MKDFDITAIGCGEEKEVIGELMKCNEITARHGLILTENQIRNLVADRRRVLKDTGRMEFGEGTLKKLIVAFCDSPYLDNDHCEEILCTLQEAFYTLKNESHETLSDDTVIQAMKAVFNGQAQGSADFISGLSPQKLLAYADIAEDPFGNFRK